MNERIEITVPYNSSNVRISVHNRLVGDVGFRNDNFEFPLPEGKWVILERYDKKVILIRQ